MMSIQVNKARLSTFAHNAVSGGPAKTTVTAKTVTSWPATGTDIARSLARAGIRPIIINSVVTMTNAASERAAIDSFSAPAFSLFLITPEKIPYSLLIQRLLLV